MRSAVGPRIRGERSPESFDCEVAAQIPAVPQCRTSRRVGTRITGGSRGVIWSDTENMSIPQSSWVPPMQTLVPQI